MGFINESVRIQERTWFRDSIASVFSIQLIPFICLRYSIFIYLSVINIYIKGKKKKKKRRERIDRKLKEVLTGNVIYLEYLTLFCHKKEKTWKLYLLPERGEK